MALIRGQAKEKFLNAHGGSSVVISKFASLLSQVFLDFDSLKSVTARGSVAQRGLVMVGHRGSIDWLRRLIKHRN